ncbi:AT-rich interactive domain-containing protein 3 [Turnera subulata]|uniref:AT-rich interactive domain-containing protein 3 n=1 Tax=Turnera subulata TaxID=218843 RepID=A0A9Q0GAH8_9ROSI|nr:AT-rich interactive domain-containing protein 3 [Turnera subulata]
MVDAQIPEKDKQEEAASDDVSTDGQNPPQIVELAPQKPQSHVASVKEEQPLSPPPPPPITTTTTTIPPPPSHGDVAEESQAEPAESRPTTPKLKPASTPTSTSTCVIPTHTDTPSIVAAENASPQDLQFNTKQQQLGTDVDAKVEVTPLSPHSSPETPKTQHSVDGQGQDFGVPDPHQFKNHSSTPPQLKPLLHSEPQLAFTAPSRSFLLDPSSAGDGYESGTEEEQVAFMKDVQSFYKDNGLDFKPPKFYKEELNLLKLWRAVIKLGGYEQVTSCKLWRQVGESFRPPKTCTTVSWTFRIFYEKALLEYEKHKMQCGELPFSDGPLTESVRVENQACGSQALGSGRARRDAAARAMQGWHSQRLLGNGQDKNSNSTPKSEKQLKTNGLLKRKKPSTEHAVLAGHMNTMKPQGDIMVIDIGPPADWVKINVQRTNDCFEVYALVPGLLREEVHVQSDPAGRLIISGQPEELDNPWGVTPFKKVVSLPMRIDSHQTSAVVTLHGQLFVRVPFEQSDF